MSVSEREIDVHTKAWAAKIALMKQKTNYASRQVAIHVKPVERPVEGTSNPLAHTRSGSRGLMIPVIRSQTEFTAGRTVSHGKAEPVFAFS